MKVITITGMIDEKNNKIITTTIGYDFETNRLITDNIKEQQLKVINAILKGDKNDPS